MGRVIYEKYNHSNHNRMPPQPRVPCRPPRRKKHQSLHRGKNETKQNSRHSRRHGRSRTTGYRRNRAGNKEEININLNINEIYNTTKHNEP